jgi:hypothetical protein
VSLEARTFTPLGVFGLYVAGHVYCRQHKWHVQHGYIPQDDPRWNEAIVLNPNFKFEKPTGDYSPAMY